MTITISGVAPPSVAGITRKEFLERLHTTGLIQTGTVTSGNSDHIIDSTRLKSKQYSPSQWKGGWIRISSTTDNLTPEGQIQPIDQYEPETGKISVSPFFGTAPDPGDTYELWKIDPQIVLDIIDQALQEDIYSPCWTILSEIPDYDMEQDGVDYWDGINATVTKESDGARLSDSGVHHLKVLSTAANGYAESEEMAVEPNRSYHLSAVSQNAAGNQNAKLQLWDKTNDVEIKSKSHNRQYPVRIAFNSLLPKTCYSISARLISIESGVETKWNDVSFFPTYASDIALPWWVQRDNQVKGVFQLSPFTIAQDLWDPELRGEIDQRYDTIPSRIGFSSYRLRARVGTIHPWPLFIFGLRKNTPYADDNADKKFLEPSMFEEYVKAKIYDYLSQPLITGAMKAEAAAQRAVVCFAKYQIMASEQASEINKILQSETPNVRMLDSRFRYGA